MNDNPLQYNKNKRLVIYGRKSRLCLPNLERDQFINECAKNGHSISGLRQKNRYIDEFLVFVKETYNVSATDKLIPEYIVTYRDSVYSDPLLKISTKASKVRKAKQWLRWLYTQKIIDTPLI